MTEDNQYEVLENTRTQVLELLRKNIRPEFLNRIDETVVFTPLSQQDIEEIVRIQIKDVQKRLKANDVTIDATDDAIHLIAARGYDPQFGARPVKRALQRDVLNQLSRDILKGTVTADSIILIDAEDGQLVFRNEGEHEVKA